MLGDETQDPDDDNDGIADAADNCPTTAGASQADAVADGTPDGGDRCLLHAGPGGCPAAAVLALKTPRRLARRAFLGGVRFTVTPDSPSGPCRSLSACGRYA